MWGVAQQAEHRALGDWRVRIGQAQHVQGAFGEHDSRPGGHPARPDIAKDAAGGLHQQARRFEIVVQALRPMGRPVAAQSWTTSVERAVFGQELCVDRFRGIERRMA